MNNQRSGNSPTNDGCQPNDTGRLTDEDVVIDCDSCLVRGDACGDCVVSVLLGPPDSLVGVERTALAVLAGCGLVPPLRLVAAREGAA